MGQRLFGTDGIRGKAGEFPINADGAYRLGRVTAAHLAAGGTVHVGRDGRPSGVVLAEAMTAGLRAGGCDVVELGVVPTPAVAYFVAAHGAAAGVSISASHNPASENGFKLFGPGGEKLAEPIEDGLAEAFLAPALPAAATARGSLTRHADAAGEYVEFAVGTVAPAVDLRGLKVAVDCARGATSQTTPRALERLGVEVVAAYCDGDGARINEGCGSLHPEAVQAVARQHGARIGLAHDGDGDRLVLVDERGEVVNGDRILGLSAVALRERGELTGDRVVGTILSNLGLEHYLSGLGVTFCRSDVGDRNVWKMMNREDADLGGEPSGHTILRRLSRTDDALLTALHVLSLMASSGRELHELARDIPLLPQATKDLRVTARPPLTSLPQVAGALGEADELLGEDSRLIVRYSGTEPVARILAEGPEPNRLQQAVAMITAAFQAAGLVA